MKVILNSDIEHLGEEGKVVTISDGYARNFLLPRKLCLPHTPQNIALIKGRQKAIEERRRQKYELALSLKERLEKTSLRITVPVGETGRLFGSVNNGTVSELLASKGFDISRRSIELTVKHIKVVGNYTAKIKLYGQELALCPFEVVSDKTPVVTDNAETSAVESSEVAEQEATTAASELSEASAPEEVNDALPTEETEVVEVAEVAEETAAPLEPLEAATKTAGGVVAEEAEVAVSEPETAESDVEPDTED